MLVRWWFWTEFTSCCDGMSLGCSMRFFFHKREMEVSILYSFGLFLLPQHASRSIWTWAHKHAPYAYTAKVNQFLGLPWKAPSDFKAAQSNSKFSPNWSCHPYIFFFYSSATIELNHYAVQHYIWVLWTPQFPLHLPKLAEMFQKMQTYNIKKKTGCPNHLTAVCQKKLPLFVESPLWVKRGPVLKYSWPKAPSNYHSNFNP